MKSTPEFRLTFGIPGDSIRRDSLHGSPRKRIFLDVSPLRLWQILVVELVLTLLLLMLIMPLVRGDAPNFTTTADFDAGTKTNTETISDPCHLQASANRFSLAGAGNYVGINGGCIAGTKTVPTTNLHASYDMSTLRSGALQDFVGTNDCTLFSAPSSVVGLYGNAYQFTTASSQYANCPGGSPTTSGWTVFVILKPTSTAAQALVSLDTAGGNHVLLYNEDCNLAADVGKVHACRTNTNDASATMAINAYHYLAWVSNNVNSTHDLYLDGVWKSSAANANGGTSDFNMCRWVAGLPSYCSAIIDEVSIWNRILTGAEILALSTDGRGHYATSGNWMSALQAPLNAGWTLTRINLTWTPAASSIRHLAGVSIRNLNGTYLFVNSTVISTGTEKGYVISPAISPRVQWVVQVNLTGNGADTLSVLTVSVSVSAGEVIDFGQAVSMFVVFTFLALLVLGVMGAVWLRHRFA